jgi:hypothetical protein
VDLWSRLDAVRGRWNVLEHPFYERWSAGGLSREDLARYAGQYRHAVVALANAADHAAHAADEADFAEVAAHAGEEAAHVALYAVESATGDLAREGRGRARAAGELGAARRRRAPLRTLNATGRTYECARSATSAKLRG